MPRYFSLAEANATLPLVRRIVADITVVYPAWRELVAEYELVAAQSRPEWGESPEQIRLRTAIEARARDIAGYLAELEQIGCVFKGFDQGLVDFYGKLDGRDIFWCWKVGEVKIEYWHEIDAGFAGRQAIAVALTPNP
jgi:hypothetical protein